MLLALLKAHGHEVLQRKRKEAWDALQQPDAPSL